MKSCGDTMRPGVMSCVRRRIPEFVTGPSAGYLTPWSSMNAGRFAVMVPLVYAMPVSSTATVIVEPACGWMSQAFSSPINGRFHCID